MEGADVPWEWLIGRVCEEFPALKPSDVLDEPLPLLLEIMTLRAYARAKERVDDADDPHAMRHTRATREVMDIRAEITRRKLRRQGEARPVPPA